MSTPLTITVHQARIEDFHRHAAKARRAAPRTTGTHQLSGRPRRRPLAILTAWQGGRRAAN